MSTYDIRPFENATLLAGPDSSVRHPDLWVRNAGAAIEYASFSARRDGGIIRVFNVTGTLQLEREVRKDSPVRAQSLLELHGRLAS